MQNPTALAAFQRSRTIYDWKRSHAHELQPNDHFRLIQEQYPTQGACFDSNRIHWCRVIFIFIICSRQNETILTWVKDFAKGDIVQQNWTRKCPESKGTHMTPRVDSVLWHSSTHGNQSGNPHRNTRYSTTQAHNTEARLCLHMRRAIPQGLSVIVQKPLTAIRPSLKGPRNTTPSLKSVHVPLRVGVVHNNLQSCMLHTNQNTHMGDWDSRSGVLYSNPLEALIG